VTESQHVALYGATLAVTLWTALVLAGPWIASSAQHLGSTLYLIGAVVCHQRPERSFHWGVAQLPVCARCLGLYAGAAAGLVWWVVRGLRRPRAWPRRAALAVLAAAALPTAVTILTAVAGLGDPPNLWRAALALPLGVAGGCVAGASVTRHLH
jgi:uncharacterized membrane protein